jgi:tetratricopeptide (TPR) repeat protein
MQHNPLDWEEEYPEDSEEKYQSLVNSIAWTSGFRLLFVSSTPAQGEEIIERVKKDLPQKEIEVLDLTEAIDNLYDLVAEIVAKKAVDVLFIRGLEYSFYEYELTRPPQGLDDNVYDWRGVPGILNHLNQRREQFRDNFPVCFVFMLRTFSVKYFIRRAPDFFDWLSSLIVFPREQKEVESESLKLLLEGGYQKYLNYSDAEREAKIIEIQSLLNEEHQTQDGKANLWFQLGLLLNAVNRDEEAIKSYDQALHFQPDYHQAWYGRGYALDDLGRYEEAIKSYDQALHFQPDYHLAWYNRGYDLGKLGRYEEAIKSYDQALHFKPDKHEAWYSRDNIRRKILTWMMGLLKLSKN